MQGGPGLIRGYRQPASSSCTGQRTPVTGKQLMRRRSSVDGVDTTHEEEEQCRRSRHSSKGTGVPSVIGLGTQAWRLLVHRRGAYSTKARVIKEDHHSRSKDG